MVVRRRIEATAQQKILCMQQFAVTLDIRTLINICSKLKVNRFEMWHATYSKRYCQ